MKLIKPYKVEEFPNEWEARNFYILRVKLGSKAIIKKQDGRWIVKYK